MMVSSKDVARLAGVSQPTVSRALRGDPRLTEATKQKVRSAAEQLGYSPNAFGRALATGRSTRVGLLVTDLDNHFFINVLAAIHDELGGSGHEMILLTESSGADGIEARVSSLGLGGVILATTTTTSLLPIRLADRSIPFVYFNRVSELVAADSVQVDPEVGLGELAAALAELGHEQVGAVLGPSNTSTGVAREIALRRALAAHGLTLRDESTRRGDFSVECGNLLAGELLDAERRPSVIVCGNDDVALGALNAAAARGLRVPEDVSVVGFDDLPTASWPIVQLTTVRYDLEGMARAAARAMVRRMESVPGAEVELEAVMLPSSLVRRRSLGVAPSRS